MEIVHIEGKKIEGLRLRTSNAQEMNPNTAIIESWQRVWSYFLNVNCPNKRRFTTDFEFYDGPEKVSIYIAIE